jgi:regulator of RNase E activity RraA
MHSSIKPVFSSAKMVRVAFTVTCPSANKLTIHKAMRMPPAGSVLVVYAGAYTEGGLGGAIMALRCKIKADISHNH